MGIKRRTMHEIKHFKNSLNHCYEYKTAKIGNGQSFRNTMVPSAFPNWTDTIK
jgi:hypothetical protein